MSVRVPLFIVSATVATSAGAQRDDSLASYPGDTHVGRDSIRTRLYMNVGGGQMGENGLPDNRLYNHLNAQPAAPPGPRACTR